jgi:hypothetical protein
VENDLAEIKERQGLLEAGMNALESRLDGQQGWLDILTAMAGPTARANAEHAEPEPLHAADAGPAGSEVTQLLRSIVLKQSMHSTSLRNAARAQQSGQSRLQATMDGVAKRLDSIADTLRRIEGGHHDR